MGSNRPRIEVTPAQLETIKVIQEWGIPKQAVFTLLDLTHAMLIVEFKDRLRQLNVLQADLTEQRRELKAICKANKALVQQGGLGDVDAVSEAVQREEFLLQHRVIFQSDLQEINTWIKFYKQLNKDLKAVWDKTALRYYQEAGLGHSPQIADALREMTDKVYTMLFADEQIRADAQVMFHQIMNNEPFDPSELTYSYDSHMIILFFEREVPDSTTPGYTTLKETK